MSRADMLKDIPLKVRVVWKPHYYVVYPDEMHLEPEDFTFQIATHFGSIGESMYGTVSIEPQTVEIATPEGLRKVASHESDSLWDGVKEEIFENPESRAKFVDAMSKAVFTAVMYRKAGVL